MRYIMIKELKRYDVVLVDFGENTIGSEQSGLRPAIVVQNDTGNFFSNCTIVIPLTTRFKNLNQPTHTLIRKGRNKGLIKDSMVLGECLRQISEKRIQKILGKITDISEQKAIRECYEANFGE